MSDSIDTLKELALLIRNATQKGENTAERVGRVLVGIIDCLNNEDISDFVTLDSEQEIIGLKHFAAGLSVGPGKHKLYEKDGVVYFDGDLAVTGGITQYATDGVSVPSMWEGIPFDNQTIWLNPETKKVEVIGGTGSDFDASAMWTALSGSTNEQINKSHLTTALSEYATTESVSTLQSEITKKWTQDDAKIKNWDTAFGWGDHKKAGYAHLAGEETFTGLKHFSVGLTVGAGKHKLYEKDGVVYFDGDLAVTGGITQYALGDTPVSTIMDGVATDNVTIKKENGKLVVIGGGGSSFDSAEMWKLLEADTTEQINRSHLTTALQGYATETWATNNLLGKNSNAISASKLQTARTIWGQSFDGTNNVTGTLSNVAGINFTGDAPYNLDSNANFKATSNSDNTYWHIDRYDGTQIIKILSSSGKMLLNHVEGVNFHNEGAICLDQNGNIKMTINNLNYYWCILGLDGVPLFVANSNTKNIGLGTDKPSQKLHVVGGTKLEGNVFFKNDGFKIDDYGNMEATVNSESYYWGVKKIDGNSAFCVTAVNGNVGINITNPSEKLHVNGNILSTGGITQYSDKRAKTIIEQISLPLQSIADTPAIRFKWNGWKQQDDGKTHIGGIAQYVQRILPEAIYNTEGVLTMDYATTGYIFAVNTAKHLLSFETKTDKEIKKLKQRVKYLEKQLKKLGYEETGTMAN